MGGWHGPNVCHGQANALTVFLTASADCTAIRPVSTQLTKSGDYTNYSGRAPWLPVVGEMAIFHQSCVSSILLTTGFGKLLLVKVPHAETEDLSG